jgi:tetratricopeptide (TPR) repeat protein
MSASNAACANLHPFIDGELDDVARGAFRTHLATCSRCPTELETSLMCDAVAEEALVASQPQTIEIPTVDDHDRHDLVHGAQDRDDDLGARRMAKRRILLSAAALVLAAAGLAVFVGRRTEVPLLAANLSDDSFRTIEGRLAYAGFDRHRPLRRERGGASVDPWSGGREQTLAALQDRSDEHGLGVAMLLEGKYDEAARHFDRANPVPATLIDAAALALERGDGRAALAHADRALALAPRSGPALWNRALALELLGRAAPAIAAFEAVAALGEPGWADEARAHAAALRSGAR